MKLYSYVVARDYGFAPNPFFGFCTLATCKPVIRRTAQIGDWVVGTGSASEGRQDRIVFAMRVTDTMTLDDYWCDSRFLCKRPKLSGSKKQAFGDNIYHRDPNSDIWTQDNSHHSHPNGSPNQRNIAHDTKTNRVLVSDDYIYWGGAGPKIPARFSDPKGIDLYARRGHKNKYPDADVQEFVVWLRSHSECGYLSAPLDWARPAWQALAD